MTSRSARRNGAPTTSRVVDPRANRSSAAVEPPKPLPRRPILLAISGALVLVWLGVLCWLAWRG